LLSTSLAAWNKLRVKILTFYQQDSNMIEREFLINEKYIGLFQEVVHNLLSNAFKHSGEKLETRVVISLTVTEKNFIISCSNSVKDHKFEEVSRQYGTIVKLAKSRLGKRARDDKLSGFQKIRQACSLALHRQPIFNIQLFPKPRRFVIELTVRGKMEIII